MGTFRLLLAISVVVVHAAPFLGLTFVGGVVAVQAFYIISGFYMAMILTEKYPPGPAGTATFYGNRFLRIYPLYWLVLVVAATVYFCVSLLPGEHHNALSLFAAEAGSMNPLTAALLSFSNIGIVGLDWWFFVPLPLPDGTDVSQYYLVPQAWTLGLEVVVYAIAPLLFRRSVWTIAAVIVGAVVLRAVCYARGLTEDPWTYRFLPFELGLFCVGALAYRAAPSWLRSQPAGWAGAAILAVLLLLYRWLPAGPSVVSGFGIGQLVFLLATGLFVPALFALTKAIAWDKFLGELSYPVYLSHLIVVQVLSGHYGPGGVFSVLGAIVLAGCMVVVSRPIEKLRRRRASRVTARTVADLVPDPSGSS